MIQGATLPKNCHEVAQQQSPGQSKASLTSLRAALGRERENRAAELKALCTAGPAPRPQTTDVGLDSMRPRQPASSTRRSLLGRWIRTNVTQGGGHYSLWLASALPWAMLCSHFVAWTRSNPREQRGTRLNSHNAHRKWLAGIPAAFAICAWLVALAPVAGQSVEVGLRKQLFIDDYIVASTEGTTRKLHQPVKHEGNPVISPPAPQPGKEELLLLGGSVIYDEEERLFKMWYEANNAKRTRAAMAYATSTDGINWDMPCFNTISYPEWDAPACNSGKNNFLWGETTIEMYTELVLSVLKDPHETDPARRYKMVYRKDDAGAGTGSVWTNVSPDGIHWTHETSSIIQDADSFHSALWDPGLGKYVVHSRFNRNNHPTLPPQRQVLQSESDDFVNWTTYGVILKPDERDPPDAQFYNMEWMPYEGVFVGFPAVFHTVSDRIDVQLAFSRDDRNWERAGDREVFIPNSQTPGDYDYGMIWNVLQHPVVVGDEIFIYYNGASGLHGAYWSGDPQGGVIGLAKLRLDGFVSIVDDAGPGPGTLTTKPLTTSGQSLVVNADAKSGSIQVEILDSAGVPVPGFGKADSDPITGDDVRHVVTWNGKCSLAALGGGPFSLKFHVEGAALYSFVFSGPGVGPSEATKRKSEIK
ncbi:hypothetical protein OAS39_04595 [Pirellulales bacterium]|nr:hypothetical protein [Pirellulales bacterium]